MVINQDLNTKESQPIIKQNNFYTELDLFYEELENYKRLNKKQLKKLILDEVKILNQLSFNPSSDLKKETLLLILFLLRIYSNVIESIYEMSDYTMNWKDLFYISLLEEFTPDVLINNTIREIKRKKSFQSRLFIKNLLNNNVSRDNFQKVIKTKQTIIDDFRL